MFSELGLWFGVSHEFCKVLKCYYCKYFLLLYCSPFGILVTYCYASKLFHSYWMFCYTTIFLFFFFCLCISTLYVVLFSYSNLPIISWEIYLCVVNKYLFFISVAVFFLIPGDLLNPGIELSSLESPALAGRVFITAPPGIPLISKTCVVFFFFSFFLS